MISKLMTAPVATVIMLNSITWKILMVHFIETLLMAIPASLAAFALIALAMRFWNPYIRKLRERDRADAEAKK